MLLNLPWTVVSLILYNIIAFTSSEAQAPETPFNVELFSMDLLSGGNWSFTLGDLVLLIAFIALFIEIVKSARISNVALFDHGLSILVFIICLVEFILVPQAATSLFFFIMFTALIDVVGGFSVGLSAARRDLGVG